MALLVSRTTSLVLSPSRRAIGSATSHSYFTPSPSWTRTLEHNELDNLFLSSLPSSSPRLNLMQQNVDKLENALKNNFTLAVGKAIDTLRDDLPNMMTVAPNLEIFSENVILTDSNGHQLVKGRKSYGAFFAGLRWGTRLTLSTPTVKILSLRYLDWRSEISVRFSVEMETPLGMDPLTFDAVSVYKLDSKGLIYEHRVDDTMLNHLFDRSPVLKVPGTLLWGGQVASPVPMPF